MSSYSESIELNNSTQLLDSKNQNFIHHSLISVCLTLTDSSVLLNSFEDQWGITSFKLLRFIETNLVILLQYVEFQ